LPETTPSSLLAFTKDIILSFLLHYSSHSGKNINKIGMLMLSPQVKLYRVRLAGNILKTHAYKNYSITTAV